MRERSPDDADPGRSPWRAASSLARHALIAWLILLPVLTAVAVLRHREELGPVAAALRAADPRWVAVGIGFEVATLLMAVLTYRLLLRRLGHRVSCLALASAHVQRGAVGAVSPASGPTSVYVFLRILARRHVPTQDGMLVVALRAAAGQGAFALILIAALALHGSVSTLLGAGGVAAAMTVFVPRVRRPTGLAWRGWAGWSRHLPGDVARWLDEFRRRFRRHRLAPRDLAWPLVLAVGARAGAVGLLVASLRALGVEAAAGTVVAVYLAALLANATVPILGGAGIVEGAAAVALARSGVPGELAIGAALLWRLIDFWLPLGVGLAVHAATLLGPRRPRFGTALTPEPAGPPTGSEQPPSPGPAGPRPTRRPQPPATHRAGRWRGSCCT